MNEGITVQQLEAEIKKLDAQKALYLQLIALKKGGEARGGSLPSGAPHTGGSSVRGRIIDAVVDLIHQTGRQVTNKEILAHIEEKQLSLGNMKNKVTGLGAILSQESKKPQTARIKQVARGTWDVK